ETLGRREDEARGTRFDLAQCALVVAVGHSRREHRRAHARALEALSLVGHERDERADDHDEAVARERGELVAERLSPSGGHHDEAVAALERGANRLALPRTEALEAEAREQLLGCRGRDARRGHQRANVARASAAPPRHVARASLR